MLSKKFHLLRDLVAVVAFAAFILTASASAQERSTLNIAITGLHSDTGKVCVRLWNKKDGFPTDDKKAFRMITVDISHGSAKAVFSDIPYGSYAVSTWHDENSNGKFDTRFPGIPHEGYGISNATRGKFGPPSFQPSVFVIAEAQIVLPVRIEY